MDATPQAAPSATEHSLARARRPPEDGALAPTPRFFRVMALIAVAITFVGFLPTFFLPLAQGTFVREPVVYIHGVLFFGWVVFFFIQTWQVGRGQILAHREWGVFGAALVSAMVFSVMTVVVVRLNHPLNVPRGAPGSTEFAFGQVLGPLTFAAFVTAGLANVRRPEVHKRLMLLATLSILGAPLGRWIGVVQQLLPVGPPPLWLTQMPGLVTDVLVIAAMVYDYRSMRRVSWVYLLGLPIIIGFPMAGAFIGFTPAWQQAAAWLRTLGG